MSYLYEEPQLEGFRRLHAAGADREDFRPDLALDTSGPEYVGRDFVGRDFVGDDDLLGWSPFKAISHAISSVPVVGEAVHRATTIPRLVGKIAQGQNVGKVLQAEAPTQLQALARIARGENVLNVAKGTGTQLVRDRQAMIKEAARRSAYVPGVGTATATGLQIAAALSEGKDIRTAVEQGVVAALPAGEFAQRAGRVGVAGLRGQNMLRAGVNEGLSYAQSQVPGGQLLQNLAAAVPLGAAVAASPMVQVMKNGAGAALTFGDNVPPSAALATVAALTKATQSNVPGVAAAANQVISNTKALAATGHLGAGVALGALQQSLAANVAIGQAKSKVQRFFRR